MKQIQRFQHATMLGLMFGVCWASAQFAYSAAFTHSIDFAKLGVTPNFACGGKGACGAVSTINSFIFLQKEYPAMYDNKLAPNYNAMTNTDMVDAQKFGFDGWQVGTNPMRQGYYNRPGGAESDFLQTKKDWINDYAPGTTRFSSWWPGSPDNNRFPTIMDLAEEMRKKEDVEFFVQNTDPAKPFYHVMTLTEVSCDATMLMCSIRYQDPNNPTVNQPSTPITVMNNMLLFTNVPGSNYMGQVKITAAFSESPIPEPASVLMILAAGVVLVLAGRQSRG
jgi:hypothetical protein